MGTSPTLTIDTVREARGRVPGDGISLAFGFWPGTGQTVVALHGLTASYVNFVGVADRLRGRRPLLALDLRGRGDSDKPDGPHGMAQHAKDVAAALDAFGLDNCIVVGHSMGAYVAVALAAEHPDKVSGLLLVDGGPPLSAPPGVDVATLLDVALGPQVARLRQTFPSHASYLDFWRGLPVFTSATWGPWVERYLGYDLGGTEPELQPKASEAAVRADFLDQVDTAVLRARLHRVSAPMLLLRAEEGFSPGQPPILSDDLVARECDDLPSFAHRTVAGTTHYTIALADPGASIVADALVDLASACGR